MSVLFDKKPKEDRPSKPFTVVLDKYKSIVIVNSVDVDETDECLLHIDFDHEIKAPEDEVANELGRVILQMLKDGLGYKSQDATVEIDKE